MEHPLEVWRSMERPPCYLPPGGRVRIAKDSLRSSLHISNQDICPKSTNRPSIVAFTVRTCGGLVVRHFLILSRTIRLSFEARAEHN
jgi:hypothetical protein